MTWVIKTESGGFYYRRGPNPHWTKQLDGEGGATPFDSHQDADTERRLAIQQHRVSIEPVDQQQAGVYVAGRIIPVR